MLVFEEHFQDNRHDWYLHDCDKCTFQVRSHYYFIHHKRLEGHSWLSWKSVNYPFYDKDFHIYAVFEKITGNLHSEYGIVWGLSDTKNFFEFVIADNRYYRVSKHENGDCKNCIRWKQCHTIRYPNAPNILEIRRSGNDLELYINSVRIETLPFDSTLPGKSFGFVIYNEIQVKVHSLIISISSTENNSWQNNSPSNTATKATFLEHELPSEDNLEKIFADLNALIGHRDIKQQLSSLVSFLKVQTERKARNLKTVDTSLHLVLGGPPGTGKTTIARFIGRLYKQLGWLQRGHVVEVDRAGIVGGYIGQTALRMDDAVKQALGGVLFIDEAYALAPKGGFSNDYGLEALQVLLKRMEDYRNELAVIVAGYTEEMEHFIQANPGLQSRFNRFFYLDHYTPSELILIFAKFCHDNGYAIDISARLVLQTIFETAYTKRDKRFGNGRFVRNLFERSVEQQANRIAENVRQLDNDAISLITTEDLWIVEA